MQKEKTAFLFEVCYLEINGAAARIPITAQRFSILDGYLVFFIEEESVFAFKEWHSVRKMPARENPQPPSEFAKLQLELIQKKKRPVEN